MRNSARPALLVSLVALLTAAVSVSLAAEGPAEADADETATIVVTATRLAAPAFELPAAISTVDADDIHSGTLGINLADALPAVPGLVARDRQNYAQDTQISIRGFGARSSFGVRGLRLHLDGIPATQPDGQGQVAHFNLASASRIEVLRGPFSALYGNSSGGVIQMFTADAGDALALSGDLAAGSFGGRRASLGASGPVGGARYRIDYTHFSTDGFRDHSAARRDSLSGKLGFELGARGKLSVLLNTLDAPDARDPLGLTRAQFDADPAQAAPAATLYNTRKSVRQAQLGAIYEHALSTAQNLRLLLYYGDRRVQQYLAVPAAAQANPGHSGGVVDLESGYGGGDLRWSWRGALAERPLTLVAGISHDVLDQRRRGYENFITDTLGVRGALRRDEDNRVRDLDQYLQADWDFASRWSLLAGVRHSDVGFRSADHYISDSNPDDSGARDYTATTPVAGLRFRAAATLNLYAAYGHGFETPTFAELAYRPDGQAGLNFDLDAATSRNAELGAKWAPRAGLRGELALFESRTRDELVVAANSGGRATYDNAGRTRRRGVEAWLEAELRGPWRLRLAYTLLDARVREAYSTCTGTPCLAPTPEAPAGSNRGTVAAGTRLAGVPASSLYAVLGWGRERGWGGELEGRYLSRVEVNDLNSEAAPSYGLFAVSGGYRWQGAGIALRSYVRVDNLFAEHYVGSVIVNDGNGRYYEPGPGRSIVAGLALDWH